MTSRGHRRAGFVDPGVVAVRDQFRHVAVHVVQAEGIVGERAGRDRPGAVLVGRAGAVVEAGGRGGERCYAAVEASYTVNGRDSSRAIRNAGLLTKFTGCRSYAVVAGLRRDDRIQDRVDAGEVFWYQLTPEAVQAD